MTQTISKPTIAAANAGTLTAGTLGKLLEPLKAIKTNTRQYTLPILAHTLMTCSAGCVTCYATDLDLGVVITFAAPEWPDFSLAVPMPLLLKTVASCSKTASVTMAQLGEQLAVRLTCGTSSTSLVCMHADEFPNLLQETPSFACDIHVTDLRTLIDSVAFAAKAPVKEHSYNDRPLFHHAATRRVDDRLYMACADTYRLARNTAPLISYDADLPEHALPAYNLTKIARYLPKEGLVTLAYGETWAWFTMGPVQFFTTYGDGAGDLPAHESIIRSEPYFAHAARVILPTVLLRDAVKSVAMVSNPTNTMRLNVTQNDQDIEPSTVTLITSDSEVGDKASTVPCMIDGNCSASIFLNRIQVEQALAHITTPECVFLVTSAQIPVRIEEHLGQGDYQQVIMPLYQRG